MAPAMRMNLFKDAMLQHIQNKTCPKPTMYILSKVGELDDDVGPYGKSLLYLVSNALEGRREMPILGMHKFLEKEPIVLNLLTSAVDGRPGLVVAGEGNVPGAISKSDSHGGFDNDPNTMNSLLTRILNHVPNPTFTERDLQF